MIECIQNESELPANKNVFQEQPSHFSGTLTWNIRKKKKKFYQGNYIIQNHEEIKLFFSRTNQVFQEEKCKTGVNSMLMNSHWYECRPQSVSDLVRPLTTHSSAFLQEQSGLTSLLRELWIRWSSAMILLKRFIYSGDFDWSGKLPVTTRTDNTVWVSKLYKVKIQWRLKFNITYRLVSNIRRVL